MTTLCRTRYDTHCGHNCLMVLLNDRIYDHILQGALGARNALATSLDGERDVGVREIMMLPTRGKLMSRGSHRAWGA
jgi:hypothetical protein